MFIVLSLSHLNKNVYFKVYVFELRKKLRIVCRDESCLIHFLLNHKIKKHHHSMVETLNSPFLCSEKRVVQSCVNQLFKCKM